MQASCPLVLFIANIPRAQKGREAFQEIDYLGMYGPIAKAVFDVASFDELANVTARALARSDQFTARLRRGARSGARVSDATRAFNLHLTSAVCIIKRFRNHLSLR